MSQNVLKCLNLARIGQGQTSQSNNIVKFVSKMDTLSLIGGYLWLV